MTRVDLCTKALTGVGAYIAAGNQAEKGKIADFVIETTNNKAPTRSLNERPPCKAKPKRTKKKQSPIRFLREVNKAAAKERRLPKYETKKKEVKPSKSQPTSRLTKLEEKTTKNIEPKKP